MARKDDARDAESPKDEKTTTAQGTAPQSLDDLGVGVAAGSSGKSAPGRDGNPRDLDADRVPTADAQAADAREADSTLGLDEVPYELAEDTPSPEELPETGLVSEFVDVGRRQASWLVSNRESSTVMRSPVFLVPVAVVILGILAAIISGIVRDAQVESGTPTMAMVGVGEQAAMYEQQLSVKITDVPDAQAAEQLVRDGSVDAAFIQDPTGQAQPTIIALDRQPTALLEKLAPQTEATLLQTPAVDPEIATPLLWGMVVFSLIVIGTLGTALYANLRLEKRNRITEIIAATIPPRAAASGRVTGMLTLVIIHLVVAAVVLELGLSISGRTSLAFAMLPGLGWFALTFLFTAWTVFALLVWASTLTGDRARKVAAAVIGILTVGGALAPVIVGGTGTVARVLSWTPFTSPLGIAGRFFSAQPEWWEGLVAAAIAAVLAIIVHALAGGAYVRSVLSGAGRGGRTVVMSKRAKKAMAGAAPAKDSAGNGSKSSTTDEQKVDDPDAAADADADEAQEASTDDVATDSDGQTSDEGDDTDAADEVAVEGTDTVTVKDTTTSAKKLGKDSSVKKSGLTTSAKKPGPADAEEK